MDDGPVQGIALGRAFLEAPSLNSFYLPQGATISIRSTQLSGAHFHSLRSYPIEIKVSYLIFDNSISFYFLNMICSSEISLVQDSTVKCVSLSDGLTEETHNVT